MNKFGPSLKTVLLKVFKIGIHELVLGLGASLAQARSKPFIFYGRITIERVKVGRRGKVWNGKLYKLNNNLYFQIFESEDIDRSGYLYCFMKQKFTNESK
jgi:hypothetical protein